MSTSGSGSIGVIQRQMHVDCGRRQTLQTGRGGFSAVDAGGAMQYGDEGMCHRNGRRPDYTISHCTGESSGPANATIFGSVLGLPQNSTVKLMRSLHFLT